MIKTLVIADDLTGANDTGALLNQAGFDTVSSPTAEIEQQYYEERDALCINADSRAMKAEDAYQKVKQIVQRYQQQNTLISKRIDSTLRGNVGSEIDGILSALPSDYKAVVVAAAPAAGRICVGGYIMVHSIPLELSGTAKDPKTPVNSSEAVAIIKEQSKSTVGQIFLNDVLKGTAHLSQILSRKQEKILVIDAVTEENIETIALACCKTEWPIICVDPGAFTCIMSRYRYGGSVRRNSRNLLIIGSLSEVSKGQLEYYINKNKTLVFKINIRQLLENYESELQRALDFFSEQGQSYDDFCITSVFSERMVREGQREQDMVNTALISGRITDIGVNILNITEIKTAFLCGGDIAKDFIEKTGAKAIDVIKEVIPLAVYGRLVGGVHDGLGILTKGGMIGQKEDVDYILSNL